MFFSFSLRSDLQVFPTPFNRSPYNDRRESHPWRPLNLTPLSKSARTLRRNNPLLSPVIAGHLNRQKTLGRPTTQLRRGNQDQAFLTWCGGGPVLKRLLRSIHPLYDEPQTDSDLKGVENTLDIRARLAALRQQT